MDRNGFAKRYIVLIIVFCILCGIYAARLVGYELSLKERVTGRMYDGNTYQYTVTIPAKPSRRSVAAPIEPLEYMPLRGQSLPLLSLSPSPRRPE